MTKGIALLVGLKRINQENYGWDGMGGCWGCELDVDNMERILAPLNYNIKTLKTEQATSENILSSLKKAASKLENNDILVFYFSGHGGQQSDENNDETDGMDETLLAFDRKIIDDELNNIWNQMRQGVRIVMLSDSCNSGTNYRRPPSPSQIIPIRDDRNFRAQMIHMGGCRDGSSSVGYQHGGNFTIALCNAWENGNFNGNYRQFYEKLCGLIIGDQEPQYNEYGQVSNDFKSQKPFHIGESDEIEDPVEDDETEQPTQHALKARVTTNVLNIRKGPGTNYQDIGNLRKNERVNINNISGKEVWVEIEQGKWAALSYSGNKYMEIISD